jgi:hypothetical protein
VENLKELGFVELVIHSFIHSVSQSVNQSDSLPVIYSFLTFSPTEHHYNTISNPTDNISFHHIAYLQQQQPDKAIPGSICVTITDCHIAVKR